MSAGQSDLADVMSRVARTLQAPKDVDETLRLISRTARETIPGVDFSSISVRHGNGRLETLAPSAAVVSRADDLQYELGEGPCVEALGAAKSILVGDVGHDERWPAYGPKAAALGIGSQMAVQLNTEDATLGALNLYAAAREAFGGDALRYASVFAAHAATAMASASELAHLNEALRTRKLIGQAIGVVMERYQLNEDRAFGYLVRVSQVSNTKLRLVAEELIGNANERRRIKG